MNREQIFLTQQHSINGFHHPQDGFFNTCDDSPGVYNSTYSDDVCSKQLMLFLLTSSYPGSRLFFLFSFLFTNSDLTVCSHSCGILNHSDDTSFNSSDVSSV